MIKLQQLSKSFGNVEVVRDINLEVPAGAFLVLVGPSGCGKSTVLRMLAGLEPPSGGTITFGENVVASSSRMVDPAERDAGLVFQSYALWPHMTVSGNVDWPLKVARWSAAQRRARIDEVLSLLGISGLANRYPGEISGGQQQRVAIARMIAPRPRILLFDEPLSNLDAKLRIEMRTELLRVHRATAATSVYVTHDQVEAMTMATHVAVMNQGRVEQFGPPLELVRRPETAFVATFVGTPPANLAPFIPGQGPTLDNGEQAVMGMYRAEDIKVSRNASGASLTLEFVEASPVAGRTMITGMAQGLRLTAIVDGDPNFSLGETINFLLPDQPAALFSRDGARLP
jgi:iron(III) transport system ATP-binding protein